MQYMYMWNLNVRNFVEITCEPEKYYTPWYKAETGVSNQLPTLYSTRWVLIMKNGENNESHYNDVIMSAMASQISSLTIVYSTVYSRHRSKKPSKLRVTGLCAGNSPVTGEFPAQMTNNAESVSIWWLHHGLCFSNHHLRSFSANAGILCIRRIEYK